MGIESYGRVFEGHVVAVGRMGLEMPPPQRHVVHVVRIVDKSWHGSQDTFRERHFGYRIIYFRSREKACVI